MYAEWTVLNIKPEHRDKAQEMMPKFAAMHESLKGFNCQTFLIDEQSGESACLSVWDTKKDLDAAVKACMPELQKAADIFAGEPSLKIYKVAIMN